MDPTRVAEFWTDSSVSVDTACCIAAALCCGASLTLWGACLTVFVRELLLPIAS